MIRMTSALLIAAFVLAGSPDTAAALADRAQFAPADHAHLFYLTTSAAPRARREQLATALRLVVASTSSQQILERCTPATVEGSDLLRIDLRELRWRSKDWQALLARYPYAPGNPYPLVVRADWLVQAITDSQATPEGYLPLLYGDRVPKTRDEFLAFWSVDSARKDLRFGLIEGESGVSVQRVRWIENRPISRGYAWLTRDVLAVSGDQDPLEYPAGDFRHDGEEIILGIPKISLATGARGALQVYLLANGKGDRVNRAPVDLVEDHSRFRGLAEIRTAGSCIQCHAAGINPPTRNEFRQLIVDGVDVYADKGQQEALEAFHLSDVGKEIARNNEDFAAAVKVVCGCTGTEAVEAFRASVNAYDADVTLADAARELYSTPAELRLALAYASQHGSLGARLSRLAHDAALPRETWEQSYPAAYAAIAQWRSKDVFPATAPVRAIVPVRPPVAVAVPAAVQAPAIPPVAKPHHAPPKPAAAPATVPVRGRGLFRRR